MSSKILLQLASKRKKKKKFCKKVQPCNYVTVFTKILKKNTRTFDEKQKVRGEDSTPPNAEKAGL